MAEAIGVGIQVLPRQHWLAGHGINYLGSHTIANVEMQLRLRRRNYGQVFCGLSINYLPYVIAADECGRDKLEAFFTAFDLFDRRLSDRSAAMKLVLSLVGASTIVPV